MNLFMKKYVFTAFLLCFLTLSSIASEAKNISLWKVEKGEKVSYVFAAFAFGRVDEKISQRIIEAAEQSNLIVVQTDNSAESMRNKQQIAISNTFMQGQEFSEIISKETYSQLEAYFSNIDKRYLKTIQRLRPWAVNATIMMTELAKTDLKQEYSPAAYIGKYIQKEGKIIFPLETPEKQAIRLNKGTDKYHEAIIAITLSDVKNMNKKIQESYEHWKNGEIEEVYKKQNLAFQDASAGERIEPNVVNLSNEYLIHEPNQIFFPKIIELLETNGGVFVMLPSMHIAGDKGLLKHLKSHGYKISQVSQ